MTAAVLTFYGWVMTALQPLLRWRLRQRGRAEPGYLESMDERFGRYYLVERWIEPKDSSPLPLPLIWLHAVSLGETRAAAVLLAALRRHIPGMRLLLTHGTATGRAEGRALLREGDVQVWQPWDAPGAVQGFLTHFRPRMGLLLETEVWPTLIAAAQAQDMPLLLVNARLSDKSARSAHRLAWIAKPAFGALTAVLAQTAADGERLTALGANVQGVFGNLKFDATPNADQLAQGRALRAAQPRPVVLLASSREGEEALFLAQLRTLTEAQRRAVQWLIVPRHPQRFDEVAALITAQGFSVLRRKFWADLNDVAAVTLGGGNTVWLGDSLGEMPFYFGLSDVALLGGSFLPFGGQNLIEAAACGCPVIMGPHTFNFKEAAENSAAAGAAFRVADLPAAMDLAYQMLQNEELLNQSQQAGSGFIDQHRGAAERTALAIVAALAQSKNQAHA